MPYYDTITEDLARAKVILAEGKDGAIPGLSQFETTKCGGNIYGKDIYAAYKLLESFVEEIERVHALIRELQQAERAMGAISAKDPLFPAASDKLFTAIDAIQNYRV